MQRHYKTYLRLKIPNTCLMLLALAALFQYFAPTSYAAEIHVPDDFPSIQDAVKSASPGDSIIVKDGTYNENIAIDKPLTLKSSAGADITFIVASSEDKPVIRVSGTGGVEVSGFSLTGSKAAGIQLMNVKDALITNNTAIKNESGIVVENSSGVTIKGNTANHNEVYGIYMSSAIAGAIENNTVNANNDKGLYMINSKGNRVMNNNVNLNTWNGITLFASHDNTVRGNNVLRNTFGIVISDSNNNDVAENTTLPNFFIILPIILLYLGIISYMIQRNVLRIMYKE